MKIAAVVVTYNRKKLLGECLNALLCQTRPLDSIILIDNASTDGTPQFLKAKEVIKEIVKPKNEPIEIENEIKNNSRNEIKICYVRMHENTGGAGGFHEGVKRGYEKGFDWLWLMDDDSKPEIHAMKALLDNIKSNSNSAFGSIAVANDSSEDLVWHAFANKKFNKIYTKKHELPRNSTILAKSIPFVGFFISQKIVRLIGFPEKEFFISTDDTEYCWRLKYKYGINLKYVTDSIIYHPRRNHRILPFIQKEISWSGPLWREYYKIRNNILVRKKYNSFWKFWFIKLPRRIIYHLIVWIWIKHGQLSYLKTFLKGLYDGLSGRTGKYIKNV